MESIREKKDVGWVMHNLSSGQLGQSQCCRLLHLQGHPSFPSSPWPCDFPLVTLHAPLSQTIILSLWL